MAEYLQFDKLLNEDQMKKYEDLVTEENFEMFLKRKTVTTEGYGYRDDLDYSDKPYIDIPFYTHIFIKEGKKNSDRADVAMQLLQDFTDRSKISFEAVYRAQVNITNINLEKAPSAPHVDATYPHHVLIYYANQSDGGTVFYKGNDPFEIKKGVIENKIDHNYGRFVLFDGKHYHGQEHAPTTSNTRIVYNFNVKVKE